MQGAGEAPASPAGKPGPQPDKSGHRRRRKRRRGRKVFARDGKPPTPTPENDPERGGSGTDPGGRSEQRPADGQCNGHPHAVGVPPAGRPRNLRRPDEASALPAYAALDLGTNNCRLLVAIPGRPGRFRVVDAFSRIVRLGEGLTARGRLADDAMARALEALKICAGKLDARTIRRSRLIATEACRSAVNGAEFIARVEVETGLALEVIDRETEARLAVSGCGSLVERETRGVVLFDIGGGSSEIALIDISRRRSRRLANHIVSWTSLPVGVVSLSERFGGRHVTPDIFASMVDDVTAMIAAFEGRERLGDIVKGEGFHLLGTSGTVTTLAGIHLELPRYDRRRVDGLWMTGEDIDRMMETLIGWEFEQRVQNPCIGADRADLVLAGCAILEAIRRTWPANRLRVADRGLREGILTELMAEDGVWDRDRRFRGRAS
ncbi:Ppx/GppA family phosphatase [Nitratireductor mangrovi]|uniref:Ppx/GppA family phosphatase n=1 Tax=Nitratireductor mangrovi TaxID=2599600 RepID=A0A5B8KXR4_9HYPH|nr:Ppx/GppA family phosphatase [Nitratireductor mangrovi]